MPSSNQKNASGKGSSPSIFALIACLVAIIIFASPAATAVLTAQRAAASVNLGEIAKAYDGYVHASTPARMMTARPTDSAHAVAVTLARTGQFNDALDWFVKSDPKLSGHSLPSSVLSTADSNAVNPDFSSQTLSYEIVANIDLNPPPPLPQLNPYSIPVAWTRGLREDGTWAPDSPWLGEGGHIAFLDGHVVWLNKLSMQPGSESLFRYGTNPPVPTTNIREALPPGAIVLNAGPGQTQP